MIKQRDAVGLLTFDEKIQTYLPPRSIKSYLFQILQQLELTKPGAQTNISLILHEMAERIKRRGLIILISDLFDEPAAVLSGLKHFRHRNHDVILFHLLDPMERTFNFKKDAIFVDLETDEEIPTQPWHISRDYQGKIDDFIKNYKNGCLENNIEYVLLDTSMPFDKALFQYLVKRKRIGG
jgi:uncharacterized protein (DUF58 family)